MGSQLNRLVASLIPGAGTARATVAALLCVALSGCYVAEEWPWSETEADRLAEKVPEVCPSYAIVKGTNHITVFDGTGEQDADVVMRSELVKAKLRCEFDYDERLIYMDVGLAGRAELGPAARALEQSLPVFVAVTEPDRRMLFKRQYDVPVNFDPGDRRQDYVHVAEELKVPFSELFPGTAYEVLIGFQLSPAQKQYNDTHDPVRIHRGNR